MREEVTLLSCMHSLVLVFADQKLVCFKLWVTLKS